MTDYYPLIGKAVAALEKNTGEARRVLYEHARAALVRHVLNLNRPLTESDVARERLALEEAICKVEAEVARCSRAESARLDMLSTERPGPTPGVDPPHCPAPPPTPPAAPLPQDEPPPPPRREPPTPSREQAPVAQGSAMPLAQREPPPPRGEPAPARREQALVARREQAAPTLRPAAPPAQGEAAATVAEAADQPRPPVRRRNRVFGRQAVATQSVPAALLEFESSSPARIEAPVKPAARSVVRTIAPAGTAVSANRVFGRRSQALATQPMLPALLEFESPTAALIEAPLKPAARSILRTVVSAIIASTAVAALFPIDMVVTGPGRVVSLQATNVVQPLETAIVRAINVREGQQVHAGEVLARLDPTFSGADVSALQAQVKSFQAEVDRLTAEASGTPYQPTSTDASTALQVAIFEQRQAQYRYQMESYNQKISGLQAQLIRSEHDVKAFSERVQIASVLESKRRELERLQVGSQMNRMVAEDQRIEMERNLTQAQGAAERARRDLQQMMAERDGFEQQWKAKISEDLTLRTRSLSDASESLRKATLRRDLVDLRADQDAVVLTVAKVSIGSVMQSGEPLITLVPTDAPLEVETRIAAADAGYVHRGQKVAIKFDTFPFVQYGMAEGTVRFISPDSFSSNQETQRGNVVTQGDPYEVFYKVRVAIDEINMQGVPGGFELKPGMTVRADIKAGTRTLLTYLFARILPIGLEGMREP